MCFLQKQLDSRKNHTHVCDRTIEQFLRTYAYYLVTANFWCYKKFPK